MTRPGRGMMILSAFVIVAVVGLVVLVARTGQQSSSLSLLPAPLPGEEVDGGRAAAAAAPAPRSGVQTGPPVATDWATTMGTRTGIPSRAMISYAGAALHLSTEEPSCKLGWPTLAAIGAVESVHGSHGGTHVEPDGRTADPILGVPLNGDGVAAIGDTDGGELDGDTIWDRAVGPMQFIPSTWALWSADGNDDDVTDPHNLDDAALAAGRYLCSSGGDLSTGADWQRAVLTYNRSTEYATKVLETANGYARASWG